MWLLTIHRSFRLSPVWQPACISGIKCAQPTMLPTLKTCEAIGTSAIFSCTNFETGFELPEISGIVVSARATQYSTNAPSSFRRLILNSHCSCHGRQPHSTLFHIPGHCFTHTQLYRRSPPSQLWLPVHGQFWDIRSPSTPSTWTLIPWEIQSSTECSCSSDIYDVLRLLSLIHSCVPLNIVTQWVASCVLSSNALMSLITASGCFPSWQFWGPMNSGFTYDCVLRGAAWSPLEGRTLQVAALFSRHGARSWRLTYLIS